MSPTLRKDGAVKIVELDLSVKDTAHNYKLGIPRPDVFRSVAQRQKKAHAQSKASDAMDVDKDQTSDDDGEAAVVAASGGKTAEGTQRSSRVMPPDECRANLRLLFANESTLCSLVFGRLGKNDSAMLNVLETALGATRHGATPDMFFVDVLAVPPTRFRPPSMMNGKVFENAQNECLTAVIKRGAKVTELNDALQRYALAPFEPSLSEDEQIAAEKAHAKLRLQTYESLLGTMIQLQADVNSFMDSTKNPKSGPSASVPTGVKQLMEKKEGLFRKNMMGKRVNFAARSVISPDVNIETNEIGVPPVFAKKLTYPERVTPHNVDRLAQMVINGPLKHPGAVLIRMEDGSETVLGKLSREDRTALARQLLTPQQDLSRNFSGTYSNQYQATRTTVANKVVMRHLQDGDIVVMNRQPTLHKPSMMAHKARVLRGERTIRMHYANCNSYNADFDGDEMNMHFPQSEAARAECYNIANTDNQYLVPTSGNPLRGLIQDHVVSGTWMTCKDSLFTRGEYQQLLYGALRPEENYSGGGRVLTMPPAIIKPSPRWTGKQIISTILLNIRKPAPYQGLNLHSKAKVGGKFWGKDHAMEEQVIVSDGELVSGVLDKSQFGATSYGLVHSVYEVYGSEIAGKLLSILSRLFSKFLQHRAFTCRMDDLVLSHDGDATRRRILNEKKDVGLDAALKTVGLADENPKDPSTKQNLLLRLEEVLRDDSKMAALDSEAMSAANDITSSVIKATIPDGLAHKFPHNHMQMMAVSGAKGSPVNVSSISCMLGQQALEGRRVPVMVSGKTLPCFRPFETAPIAGGYVAGRFLTGIKPQEYYFHCMAGREGLIDTAVKTSRSGYLQRCLIKHLEGVHVAYDHTVRNHDGSVLQFFYGEDGLDVTKSKYLEQFDFTARNLESFKQRYHFDELAELIDRGVVNDENAVSYMKKALKHPEKHVPVMTELSPSRNLGSMSESFATKVGEFISSNPGQLLSITKKERKKLAKAGIAVPEDKMRLAQPKTTVEAFKVINSMLYRQALVDAGEAVGLLAAQGVGEPSTQMTLNTFHFAGHGAANVTLGIPRLREIVMTASQNIQTPIMHLPLLEGYPKEHVKQLCKDGSRLLLSQVMDEAIVTERITPKSAKTSYTREKTFTVHFDFYPSEETAEEYSTSPEQILHCLKVQFAPIFDHAIKVAVNKIARDRRLQTTTIGQGQRFADNVATGAEEEEEEAPGRRGSAKGAKKTAARREEDSESEEDEEEDADGGADAAKRSSRRKGQSSYMDDEASEGEESESGDSEDDEEDGSSKKNKGSHAADDDSEDEVNEALEKAADLSEYLKHTSDFLSGFKFDTKGGRWAEFEVNLPRDEKVLLINLVESSCRKAVIREIAGIARMLPPQPKPGEKKASITAEGINFTGIWEFGFGKIDMDQITTNDIGALLHTYGVEAARQAIVAEMNAIFKTYGIGVSMRHLYLIADYQTAHGGFRPFNRMGLSNSSSPFQKASYETTMGFLGDAVLFGDADTLSTPSGKIVLGRPVASGTGASVIQMPMPTMA